MLFIHQFLYDLVALIFRSLRKKFIIFSLIILIVFIYFLILLINNYHHKNTDYDLNSNTFNNDNDDVNDDINNKDGGFASLKRQHKLREENLIEEKYSQIGRPSMTINSQDRQSIPDINGNIFGDENGLLSNGIKCRNSIQGKFLIADDRGQVCHRRNVAINGCCDDKHSHTRKYVCDTCQANGCCTIYEYCISCCMSPSNRDYLNKMFIDEKKWETLKIFLSSITDPFELCLIKCRTSSSSVLHENTYKSPNAKHCYKIENDDQS